MLVFLINFLVCTHIYTRPHKLLSFNSYRVKIKVTYLLLQKANLKETCPATTSFPSSLSSEREREEREPGNVVDLTLHTLGTSQTARGYDTAYYYMASSVSGQDEPNSARWLATWDSKMEISCSFGTTRGVPREKISRKPNNKSFIDQAFSVKMPGY